MSDVLPGLAGRSAMHETEREFILGKLPERGHFLEIGTLDGATCAWWAKQRPDLRILSVDPFRPGTGTGPGNVDCWMENRQPNMNLLVGTMEEVERYLQKEQFKVALVDGDHCYDGAYGDCMLAQHVVGGGGVILVHDYGRTNLPHLEGVTHGTDAFCDLGKWEVVEVFRTTGVLRRR